MPQHADVAQYHAATGLEALFGWLYLLGRTQRLRELFSQDHGGAVTCQWTQFFCMA